MISLVGFNGPEPYSIIVWQQEGADCSKTICYTQQEQDAMLERFEGPSDFYNRYDKAVIITNDSDVTYTRMAKRKGA